MSGIFNKQREKRGETTDNSGESMGTQKTTRRREIRERERSSIGRRVEENEKDQFGKSWRREGTKEYRRAMVELDDVVKHRKVQQRRRQSNN